MPAPARMGIDNCDGVCSDGLHIPSPGQSGSPNVNVNGIPVMRQTDPFVPHVHIGPPGDVHGRVVAAGSSTVNVNGLQVARIGDPLSCGAHIAQGSSNVNIGG